MSEVKMVEAKVTPVGVRIELTSGDTLVMPMNQANRLFSRLGKVGTMKVEQPAQPECEQPKQERK